MKFGLFPAMTGRQAGGPEVYETQLVRAMVQLKQPEQLDLFCLSRTAASRFPVAGPQFNVHVLQPAMRSISIGLTLPVSLLMAKVDLLHAMYVPPPIAPIPFVFTNHCFSNFLHPEFYDARILRRLNRLVSIGIRRARTVICVSQLVADLTAERFGVPRERLAVVYHGIGEAFAPSDAKAARAAVADKIGVADRYILVVGRLDARKNTLRIVEAFARLRQLSGLEDIKLVFAGRRTWQTDRISGALGDRELHGAVVETGHLTQAELALFYAGAEFLLFPSLWEGFGMPVLEAMACGVPVITSNTSALPEISGGAALLIDPLSVDEIVATSRRVLTDPGLAAQLRTRGHARARNFTWERAAKETLAVYARALG